MMESSGTDFVDYKNKNDRQLHIAVIDDGVNERVFNVGELIHNVEVTTGLDIKQRKDYDPYLLTHGTVCSAIIKKFMNSFKLSSVKILDDKLKGMAEQLSVAIEWCCENDIDLINLSLGTIDFRDFQIIKKSIDTAVRKRVVIVAACSNRNVFTCPASFSSIIGVCCDRGSVLNKREYIFDKYSVNGVEIIACGEHKLLKCDGETFVTPSSNSYAAPVITSLVGEILNEGIVQNTDRIRRELQIRSCRDIALEKDILTRKYNIEKEIEAPIIAIWDYVGVDSKLERDLLNCFRNDGYNALVITDKAVIASDGDGIVKVEAGFIENNLSSYKKIYGGYEPDVILLGLTANEDMKKINEINQAIDVDINIVFSGSIPEDCNALFVQKDETVNFIVSQTADNTPICETTSIRFICPFELSRIDELYRSLLKLFDN